VREDVEREDGLEVEAMRKKGALYGTAIVVVSVLVNLLHTASNVVQGVTSWPQWQLVYIAVVTHAAPIVATVLPWTRYRRVGAWLLATSLVGSLVFDLVYHFIVPGPDNAFTLPPGTWRTALRDSAALLLVLPGVGVLVGLWAAKRLSRSATGVARTRPDGGVARPRRGSERNTG
jgi:hypothetical protein